MIPAKIDKTVAENIRLLMLAKSLSFGDIDDRASGITGRHVRGVVNMDHGISLTKLETLARIFDCEAYEMLMPASLSPAFKDQRLSGLIKDFMNASDEGKEFIARFARRETTREL